MKTIIKRVNVRLNIFVIKDESLHDKHEYTTIKRKRIQMEKLYRFFQRSIQTVNVNNFIVISKHNQAHFAHPRNVYFTSPS